MSTCLPAAKQAAAAASWSVCNSIRSTASKSPSASAASSEVKALQPPPAFSAMALARSSLMSTQAVIWTRWAACCSKPGKCASLEHAAPSG